MPMRVFLVLILAAAALAADRKVYLETFDNGPGGWVANRYHPLPIWDGVAYCFGPWYLDSHHAPPGAGYLNMLMYLYTRGDRIRSEVARGNRFVEGGFSTNLTNATITVRMRGDIETHGAEVVLLVQAKTPKTTANFVLTGQPLRITRDWSDQTITLDPDPWQWTCLGARESRRDVYGCDDIATVLADVNIDIMLVLFPLKVVPVGDVREPHKLRAGQDYPEEPSYEVRQEFLPKGLLMVDSIRIAYP